MEKSRVLLSLAFMIAGSAVAKAEDKAVDPESVAVVTEFEEPLPATVVREMKRELERLFPIPGVRIVWRHLDEGPVREAFDHLVVARFSKGCTLKSKRQYRRENSLGFTHLSDGHVIPFLEVDCMRVTSMIPGHRSSQPLLFAELKLGRALARVLAHEMYHVLAETREHGHSGIARPAFTRHELLADAVAFEPEDLERVKGRLLESETR